MAANRKQKSGGDWGWPLIVFLFALGVWPVALLLLFSKLFGSDEKQQAWQAPPLREETVYRAQLKQETRAVKVVRKVTKSPAEKKSNARWLKIIGAILLFIGLIAAGEAFGNMLWNPALSYWLEDMLSGCAAGAGGAAMLVKGVFIDRQLKRFPKYLSVMGDREAVSIDELARTLGYSPKRVQKDLEKMIDRGYFGGTAYLNLELGYLFRSSGAGEAFRRKFEEAAAREETAEAGSPPPKEAEQGYSGILRNIRRANDQIADPVLSAKIDRLEEITAKIFRAVEEDPKKAGRIDTFLNYYLPTTQKLLNSYAEFEGAGVEGENLRQAKQKIETTMDSIVKGFEYQLDELYKADAMDVDTDIRVMEHMLRRDTGSVEQDFGLGGSAVRTDSEDE